MISFSVRRNVTKFLVHSFSTSILTTSRPNPFHQIETHLKNCSNQYILEPIYASMIKTSVHQDCFLVNQFISVCGTFDRIDCATLAFDQMEEPNTFVYNALLRTYSQCSSPILALELYLKMLKNQVLQTSFTFSALIKACSLLQSVKYGEAVHSQIWKTGFSSHVFVQTGLIGFYLSLHRINDSQNVFDDMTERDVVAWTSMIKVYVRIGDLSSARKLFDEMPERNTASWNTLIDGYSKLGEVDSAAILFGQMPARDLISWTTMITCYARNKRCREAIQVFEDMKNAGFRPDEVTMATVISACAHIGALELGNELHRYVMNNGFSLDVYIGSALIDMYSKCGNLDRSLVIFFKLREKNLFCWNSIIEGLAVHGYGEAALDMFRGMEKEKIKPNEVTFISVLSACTHSGLVEEAREILLSMTQDYSISPTIEHYGCVIDLLSKAGLIEEALNLVRNMKFEPNYVIWGAILGGCKLHGNLEIAKVVAEKLLSLEPDNSGLYGLLISMYVEANQWSEAEKIRGMMKGHGVQKKFPGSSSIEIDGKVEEFVASDNSHPLSDEVCEVLAELDGQLRLAFSYPN
ncbi:pentatricopeptide repeat-containing protein At1g06143-like [Papaver somniferum]|uniref:pentatricopeptide repeat-containing protein At1g06143-like n=1 Tax=Papaver somniferum TaxID=3469 RepID=UPI000E6F5C8A|nr:pentatricopeptide repeat-containing protein At1g06143-like [Papaver somniferum]